jgi:hypothetical protein
MGNITTDFIAATKKIHADVRAILTTLHLIQADVKVIAEKGISGPEEKPPEGPPGRSKALNVDESNGEQEEAGNATGHYFEDLISSFKKSSRTSKFWFELAALAIVVTYTCETKRTNDLTEKAVNLQFSLSRAFVQISGAMVSKSSLEDIQKTGSIVLELQNVGKSTASKVHGEFVVEFPLAKQEPSFNLNNNPTTFTHSPLYPGGPSNGIELIFVADYGTVPQIPSDVIQDLKGGTRYIVIFGRAEYEDSFGKWWTQFCTWRHFVPSTNPPRLLGFATSGCVDYNIDGGNPIQK